MGRTDEQQRVVAAPADRVFRAFVERDALAAWLPPDGMTAVVEELDARPGGRYRIVLSYVDGGGLGKTTPDADVAEGTYVEVVPGERVVHDVVFVSDDPAYAGTMRMTWSLEPVDGGTRVTFRADDVPPGISAQDHADGLASSLAQLAVLVERDA
ncbi:ATPase [Cellulomonas sp. JZ18]|uniref:SRPBCC family protein n=1 Tax=Cellulomonas sp. JZ18 TaxID=2654191 RepID=UPI0012D42438|nr:SRPBCC family protein [Cellulomonas sp. JZ18]QGQ20710.1 ATPase [Cellulomonas sp. JZ18]